MKLLQQATQTTRSVSLRSTLIAIVAMVGALMPTYAHAAEGDHIRLKFEGLDQTLLFVALALGLASIVYGFILVRVVLSHSPGDERMQSVGKAIRDGATAYLKQQIRTMVPFIILLALGLFGLNFGSMGTSAVIVAGAFVAGVAGSYFAGYNGMMIAVNANMRTANAALTSFRRSLEIAFRAGAVAGLLTVGIGLVGASLILLFGGEHATRFLIGFGFGGSLAALFMRVGGGIFTKAADVGADLVGKVEAGIPEDDPRNPAVIADNVGDNVGDCAGMAADVFESYIVTMISAIVLAAATSAVLEPAAWTRLVVFAMIVSAIGILASMVGIATVRGNDSLDSDPLTAIRGGFVRTAVISTVLTVIAGYVLLGNGKGLQTSQLTPARETLISDYRFFNELRAKVAKRTLTMAQVDKLRANRANDLKKMIAEVTSFDLYSDPLKIPNELRGVSQAAVQRVIDKSTDPVEPYEVNATDLILTPEAKDRGWTQDDVSRLGDLLGMSEDQRAPESLSGFVAVSDIKNAKFPELDYAINSRPTDQGYDPSKPYVPIRTLFGGTGDDAMIVGKVRIQGDIPARPAQAGMPGSPAQKIDRVVYQGPVRKRDLDEQIKRTKESAAATGVTANIVLLNSSPVTIFVNPTSHDLALGVDPLVARPYQLADVLKTLNYYEKSADALNAAYAKTSMGRTPSIPPAQTFQLGVTKDVNLPWFLFPGAVLVGILLAFAIERLTEYYVSTHKRPTQEVAGVSSAGAAPMLIQGFAYACESSALMTIAIVVAILAPLFLFPSALLGGSVMALYGIALVGLGLLSTTGYVLAMDTFGPISDNAQGVFEMSGQAEKHPVAAKAVGHLDAAGNTTKALTKGFAIATAVVASIALFNSYRGEANLTEIGLKLDVPEIFLGMLIGGAAPFMFSAFAINAVGRSSFQLINEVRRQFREMPGIMKGETTPDYGRCVAIVTAAAQRELLAPGVLAIFLPIAVAFGFSIGKPLVTVGDGQYNLTGAQALGGFLAGAILSGQLLAVLLANSGGMWDNAKKLIEDGLYGGKGSEAHKAAVVCDTLGDPFKDTAGPALNPLIKVMNLVALLLAPAIIQPYQNPVLIAITVVAVAALVIAIVLSKRGSFSEEMQRAAKDGAAADAHFSSADVSAPAVDASSSSTPAAAPEAPRAKRRITVEDEE